MAFKENILKHTLSHIFNITQMKSHSPSKKRGGTISIESKDKMLFLNSQYS